MSPTILAITRPNPRLLAYYVVRAMLVPFWFVVLPYHYFRYSTMRYRFDGEGIMMSWGVLFRREITLTYSRIQDIHLTSNFVQRWFGLANLEIQTAAGTTAAEMTLEGCLEVERIRDFLYAKMRGAHAPAKESGAAATAEPAATIATALLHVAEDLRLATVALERCAAPRSEATK